ncbi:hypothetical protein [Vulgatibacter sp.]|uniref:hypothetical protein n=1 Tax=Vulgatibacter sp. TaxID=1971226 RepID=UPI003563954F
MLKRNAGLVALAALLLVGTGTACGGPEADVESEPLKEGGWAGHGGTGGTGGIAGNGGFAGGMAGNGGTGGKGGYGGTGGIAGNGGFAGGMAGNGGTGGTGGHDKEKNCEICPEGKGALIVKKEFCVPAPGQTPPYDCEAIDSEEEVHIVIKKIAPKKRDIFDGFISEGDPFAECVPAGDFLIWEDCEALPPGVSCLDEFPIEAVVEEGEKTYVTIRNLIETAPVELGLLTLRKEYCLPAPGETPPYDCAAISSSEPVEVIVRDAGGVIVHQSDVVEGTPLELPLAAGDYTVEEECAGLPAGVSCFYPQPIELTVAAGANTDFTLINIVEYGTLTVRKEYCAATTGGGYDPASCNAVTNSTPVSVRILDENDMVVEGPFELMEGSPQNFNLPPGDYTVVEDCSDLPSGTTCIYPDGIGVTVGVGNSDITLINAVSAASG